MPSSATVPVPITLLSLSLIVILSPPIPLPDTAWSPSVGWLIVGLWASLSNGFSATVVVPGVPSFPSVVGVTVNSSPFSNGRSVLTVNVPSSATVPVPITLLSLSLIVISSPPTPLPDTTWSPSVGWLIVGLWASLSNGFSLSTETALILATPSVIWLRTSSPVASKVLFLYCDNKLSTSFKAFSFAPSLASVTAFISAFLDLASSSNCLNPESWFVKSSLACSNFASIVFLYKLFTSDKLSKSVTSLKDFISSI